MSKDMDAVWNAFLTGKRKQRRSDEDELESTPLDYSAVEVKEPLSALHEHHGIFVRSMMDFRERVQAGDAYALFDALKFCADSGRLVPEWVIREFVIRTRRHRSGEVKSLGEAFGVPETKHHKALYNRWKHVDIVFFEIVEAKAKAIREGRKISTEGYKKLYKEIGTRRGLSTAQVQAYYQVGKKRWKPFAERIRSDPRVEYPPDDKYLVIKNL